MHVFDYTAYGLHIASVLECPELLSSRGSPDVIIRYGTVPFGSAQPQANGVRYQAEPGRFVLRLDGIGRFLVSAGSEIVIEPAPDCQEAELRLFLLGSVFGALLHQRGLLVLHASGIETPHGAVLFVGPSGHGKSTLAAAFLQRGFRLVADDVCALSCDPHGTPLVLPAYPQIKLWADEVKRFATDPSCLSQVRPQLEKYAVPCHERFVPTAVPLYAVYVLTTSKSQTFDLQPLNLLDAFQVFVNNTYRFRLVDGLGLRQQHFQHASVAAKQARVSRVTRPLSPIRLDELTALVEKDWTSRNCGGRAFQKSTRERSI